MPIDNVDVQSLNNVQHKLQDFAKNLLHCWNERQNKSPLQKVIVEVFGSIHDNSEPLEYHQTTLSLMKSMLDTLSLPDIDLNACHEGFMKWNEYWKKFAFNYGDRLPIQIIHLAYKSWFNETKGKFCQFKKIWQNAMIRGTSEASCESIGSIMGIHVGRNRHLNPDNFSKEIVLRYNLGPMHLLDNPSSKVNFIQEVYNRGKKEYIRRTNRIDQIVTRDLAKSSAVATFKKKGEENSHFPLSFWKN